MTVDVEDYFQVSAFENTISRKDWDRLPCRVEANTRRILDLFEQHRVQATFFTLGWIAERFPALIRDVVNRGHELACHGYSHVRVTEQTPEAFKHDVLLSKTILEDVGGCKVKGYRAASYSIGKKNLWALEVLEQLGFHYSSSIYPVKHDLYGMPDAPRFSFRPTERRNLIEVPVSTVRFGNRNFPCGGGGYFRLVPYPLSKWAINQVNKTDGQSAVFYFHPWELDVDQPIQPNISFKTRFRHYLNLGRMEGRLECLLKDFRWSTMERIFLNSISERNFN